MELQTIQVDREQAREEIAHYLREIRRKREQDTLDEFERQVLAEDQAILRAYRHVVRHGHGLIRLSEAIVGGGLDERGYPRLAVARGDALRVAAEVTRQHAAPSDPARIRVNVGDAGVRRWSARMFGAHQPRVWRLDFPGEVPDGWKANQWRAPIREAMVPSIPARIRPSAHLRNYHVLFEVEEWLEPERANRDPALLKHVGGDLYAVLAVWDLTDLEASVLGMVRGAA